MPAIPAMSLLIVSNSHFATLRLWALPPYTASSKSKSSQASFRRKSFPGNRVAEKHKPYTELVDNGKQYIGIRSETKTQIQHVSRPHLPTHSGINVSVELEVSSTEQDCACLTKAYLGDIRV